jgi:hypothetical protein
VVLAVAFKGWNNKGHDHLAVLCNQTHDVIIVPHEECSFRNLRHSFDLLSIPEEHRKSIEKARHITRTKKM